MKRFLGFLALMTVLGISAFFIANKYLYLGFDGKGLISRIVPPRKNVANLLPQGPGVVGDFSLPDGYTLDVFVDLKGGLPKIISFDSYNTPVVSVPNLGKIIALADEQVDVLVGLNRPHGIVFNNGYLYVAETDKVSRYVYDPSLKTATSEEILFDLPGGGKNQYRNIKIYNNKLYTSVGSSCDSCEEKNLLRSSVLVSDLDGSNLKVFSKGLKNTLFFDFDNEGTMWGNDLDKVSELNLIEEDKNYGWPDCYGNQVLDLDYNSSNSNICVTTASPKFIYPSESEPLGIVKEKDGFLVALHGFPKIIKVNIFAGEIVGTENYLTGFLKRSEILGRPYDLTFDENGKLFITDDHAGVVYILYK